MNSTLWIILFLSSILWLIKRRPFESRHAFFQLVPRERTRNEDIPVAAEGALKPILLRSFLRHFIRLKPFDFMDDFLTARFLRYGETHKSKDLTIEMIWTTAPANIRAILSEQQSIFETGKYRRQSFSPIFRNGLFVNDGPAWKRSRTLVGPAFTSTRLRDISTLEYHIQSTFAIIERTGFDAGCQWFKPVDLAELFGSFSFDAASEFFLGNKTPSSRGSDSGGISTAERKGPRNASIFKAIEASVKGGEARLQAFHFYWLVQPQRLEKAAKVFREFVRSFVIDKLHQDIESPTNASVSPKGFSFLDIMVEHSQDVTELCDESMILVSAALGTGTSILAFIILLLARHPRVFLRLRSDIVAAFGTDQEGNRVITSDQALSLPYLGWVLNEALRLYPSAPITTRTANQDTYLPEGGGLDGAGPVLVRKGQIVVLGFYALHRRKDVWGPDAEHFIPERWENMKPGWHFTPFGGGPRKCIGMQYARIRTSFVIIRLLQRYSKIELVDRYGKSEISSDPQDFKSAAEAARISKWFTGLNIAPKNGRARFYRDYGS